jgi:glycolate oxidase FAD binding subunit
MLAPTSEIEPIADAIKRAGSAKRVLEIRGHGSKRFYGGEPQGEPLDVSGYAGIVSYEPGELVLSVRAGTPLAQVEALLLEHRQMLPFEPPLFAGRGTIGGCVATGLSGPRRPYAGAVRDYVLGVRMLDGLGNELRFGGQVIKNVAGYDLSRLMVGAMGVLGVLLEVSFKVLPRPIHERSLRFELGEAAAIETMNRWAGRLQALSASAFVDGALTVRLSGTEGGVDAVCRDLGGEELPDAERFWSSLRNHDALFFQTPTLWRVSLPPTTPPLKTTMRQLIEWGGGLRWLAADSSADAHILREQVATLGGHVTLFRGARTTTTFQPLASPIGELHRRLKQTFDPHGVLNPGRMYEL